MTLFQDVRYAVRTLRKSPSFTVTAVLTLALGIGATTAIFTVSDAMMWKPIPLPELDRLVMVLNRDNSNPNEWNTLAHADFEDLKAQTSAFQGLSGWTQGIANIAGTSGEPARVEQFLVTTDFFSTVGVQPALGRAFLPGEDELGRQRVVLLSDRLWRRSFGADPGVIGKTMRLDDENYQIIGVMPQNYDFPVTAEVWTPLALTLKARADRAGGGLVGIGRLKPGITVAQASSQIESVARHLEQQYPATNKNRHSMVTPTHDFMVGSYNQQYTMMMLVAVMFVLLIACVNVANLQLARASGRMREMAVRTALGSGRWRVIRQLLSESILISLAGAALGLFIAAWGVQMIRSNMPAEVERYIVGWKHISLDWRSLAFTLAISVCSGILAGLAPALSASRPNLHEALKEGGRSASAGRSRGRFRSLLVVSEVALAVILLVGAGLMVHGFRTLLNSGTNSQPKTLLTMRLALTENKYREPHQVAAFYRDVVSNLSALPGVRSAAVVTAIPHAQHSNGRFFTIEGQTPAPGEQPVCQYQLISPNYFDTLRIPMRAGRALSAADGPDNQPVAVVSERLVHRYFPGERSPIGKRFKLGLPPKGEWITIVGVAADVTHSFFDHGFRPVIYLPYTQSPGRWMDVAIRTDGDPLRIASAATAAIRAVDAEQPITNINTLEKLIRLEVTGLDYVAVLMGLFGVLALVLSCVGVYGVMAYTVSEQTHDLGVRIALGASRGNVLAIVFRRGLITTLSGVAIGLALSFGMARLISSLIFGVGATDPVSFVGIPAALMAAAVIAIWIPARRAMNTDPIIALRYE
ncbi:MAG: ABC transporter permease [Acidobacteriota bacterium]|nr:ABC transporter permease [Acidobacteriota bacterium]